MNLKSFFHPFRSPFLWLFPGESSKTWHMEHNVVQQVVEESEFEFFVICTPGLEEATLLEIRNWYPGLELKVEKGGVTLKASPEIGFQLNRVLKTATRILLRLSIFGCRDFPKLFKKISGFAWENWLSDQVAVDFSVSVHNSRLKMKKRIAETCTEARIARLKKKGRPHSRFSGSQRVFVRLNDDVCTLSLDTSGEILHKRGVRLSAGEAPLRESLAAALLYMLENEAGASTDVELVDPMSGSGTFLIEGATLSAPTMSRGFAYEQFTHPAAALARDSEIRHRPQKFKNLLGFEKDGDVMGATRENLDRLQTKVSIDVRHEDFFAISPLSTGQESRRHVIANPPYGERIGVSESLTSFYEKLFAQTERALRPEAVCFVLPQKVQPERLKVPPRWRAKRQLPFSNGGLPVVAMFWVAN